jgi:hypothetical protein
MVERGNKRKESKAVQKWPRGTVTVLIGQKVLFPGSFFASLVRIFFL